jgi:glycosyltransferase involved in cell wall biosynthesis
MRILFCGQSGYPSNNNATINRYVSIAKTMSYENEIIFINRIPLLENNYFSDNIEFKVINVSNLKYRPKNFLKRNFIKLFSPIFEFLTIWKLNKEKKIDWINIYTQYFGLCLFYYFLSKIFKFKTILHYVEVRSEFKNRNLFLKLNDFLYDNYSMFLFDCYVPISHFLEEYLKGKNINSKTLIIPPICDFDHFNKLNCSNNIDDHYFLYCGSSAYDDVIIFIIEAFEKFKTDSSIKLYLVLSGQISIQIKGLIEQNQGRIKLFSKLDYNKLICLYKNALALLIPLRTSKQDQARFPQKICEYVASNRIIISTNFGEVKYYFKDMNNALIADDYDVALYAEKMEWVILNISKIKELEKNAYESGRKYFDVTSYYGPIKEFLK